MEYASRGATVTGVDISPDAISWLSNRMPNHEFICADINKLALPKERLDIVNCVTVLQHMPADEQWAALTAVSKCLKIGGYLVMLENTRDYNSTHVFPHTTKQWVGMVEEAGLTFCRAWGSNFEQPLRAIARIRKRLLTRAETGTPPDGPPWPALKRTGVRLVRSMIKDVAVLLSYPVEWICQYLPIARPTHTVMIFEKR
jgi:SAM-dependent methyltransferase